MAIVTACQGEERAIFACAQAGCARCMAYLLEEYKGLIHSCIRTIKPGGVAYSEIEGEGQIGLWRAILYYQPERGVAFTTYAWRCIRGYVWRYTLEFCHGVEDLDVEKLAADGVGVEEIWQAEQMREALGDALESLPERLQAIVEQAYGLNGVGPDSLAEIGRQMGLTRERVRQLRNEGLMLLRLPVVSVRLRSLNGKDSRKAYREARREKDAWLRRKRGQR